MVSINLYKEYFKSCAMQHSQLTQDKVLNILIWLAFLCHHIHELQTFKHDPLFRAILYYMFFSLVRR